MRAYAFQSIRSGCVAGNNDSFDRWLVVLRHSRSGVQPVTLAEQERHVPDDQLAQEVNLLLIRVVAVRHVCLIAQVNEPLVREVGSAVWPWFVGDVVKSIESKNCSEHCKASDARVEHPNGKLFRLGLVEVKRHRKKL